MTDLPADLEQLHRKIASGRCRVGVYGLGYVGLPLAMRFAEVGLTVIGFDIDADKAHKLNAGQSYIDRISNEALAQNLAKGFRATSDFSEATELDAHIICVPTPLDSHYNPDLSYVIATLESFLPYTRPGQLVCLESTTWPGTTEEILQPELESKGLIPGENLALVYSPEREDPGNQQYHTATIPKVVGGVTEHCLHLGQALYDKAVETTVPVSNTRVAEMTKLLENIHRAVNIGLVNEMKIVADKMGIDIHEVIQAAATKPFGFVPYTPGPGLGGHCIPIDPFYLTWKAREYGVNTRFIELAGEINHYMPQWVVQKVAEGLNEHGKPIKGSRILVLGIAYKKNIDDTRESPAVDILSQLHERGAEVDYCDPYVPVFPKKRDYAFEMKSIEILPRTIRAYDCLVLATDHDIWDYDVIRESAKLVVDTRGRYKNIKTPTVIHA